MELFSIRIQRTFQLVSTEKDLRDLDMTTPAYLAQYGKYYAILSVTAENTGIANVELLQLDI